MVLISWVTELPPGNVIRMILHLLHESASDGDALVIAGNRALYLTSCSSLRGAKADRTGNEPFPKPAPIVLPMTRFGAPKPTFDVPITNSVSDLMHNQYRLSVLQWNTGSACTRPTQILSAACGRFHVVILQEASDHAPHVSDQFHTYTDGNDLAILLNKDTFEP